MSAIIKQKIRKQDETAKKIPVNSRVILEQARTTIQHLIDAAVELVTNSDDSYKQLEQQNIVHSGKIKVYVRRGKGGMCMEFWVEDFAEGVGKESLEEAIEYGAKTSGFHRGKSSRGLFGRGLKEAILSLGEGEIFTVRNKVLNIAKLWWDEIKEEALYRLFDNIDNSHLEQVDEDVKEFIKYGRNGTLIKIKVKNEKMLIPEYDKFKTQLSNHYALRDINSSKNRNIILIFDDEGRRKARYESKIEFMQPEGKLVIENKILKIRNYNDQIRINIWESPIALSLQPVRYDPYSKAGILIKTEGAILDNQLFRYDSDSASFYFWGEAYCDGIAKRIKKGEKGIIDPNRGGIKWKHDYCQFIRNEIEKVLSTQIQRKKEELESGKKREVSGSTKQMLKDVCSLLNRLARSEFKEWEGPEKEPVELNITKLSIYPSKANIELNEPRTLSVYAPKSLVKAFGNKVIVSLESPHIKILFPHTKQLVSYLELILDLHPKHPDIYYGYFKVSGRELGIEALVFCKLGPQEVMANLIVKKQTKRRKKKGGFISDIIPDERPDPIQRVEYEEKSGIMKILINFPGLRKYFGPGLVELQEGSKTLLAELIGEAFCRTLATKKLEAGEIPTYNEAERDIPAFNSEINKMQNKYLEKIHEIILNWKFKKEN